MAKRSREDFEPSSPDSDGPGESDSCARLVVHPSTEAQSALTSPKIIHLDSESGEAQPDPEMLCSLPPHRQTLSFISYEEYEIHYLKTHTNRCTECRKNFPTEHLLNLHIEENHDSLASVRKERGEKIVGLELRAIYELSDQPLMLASALSTPALSKTAIANAQLHKRDECI